MSIMTVGCSVGSQVEASDHQQAQSVEQNHDDGLSVSVETARRLSLDSVMEEEVECENSDLMKIAAENKMESKEQ